MSDNCEHGWNKINDAKCPRCEDAARHAEEIAVLKAEVSRLAANHIDANKRNCEANDRADAAEATRYEALKKVEIILSQPATQHEWAALRVVCAALGKEVQTSTARGYRDAAGNWSPVAPTDSASKEES